MAFDTLIFTKIYNMLKTNFIESRINKINNISNLDYVFTLYSNKKTYSLVMATNTNNAFITYSSSNVEINFPNHFTYFLRKQIEGGIILDIIRLNNDRILKFVIKSFDDLGDAHIKHLYLELTGKQTNIILTKDNDVIIDCLNKQGPNENTNRTLMPGAIYKTPPVFVSKDPLKDDYDLNYDLNSQFPTLSKNLKIEISKLLETNSFHAIINSIMNSDKLYIYNKDYHLIPLTQFDNPLVEDINEGILDFQKIKMDYIQHKELVNDINIIIKQNLKRNKDKVKKLNRELESALDSKKYMEYGDLIFTYANDKLNLKLKEIKIDEMDLIIPLDDKVSVSKNAVNYFNKYQKSQKSINILKEQISIAEDEISYFDELSYQIDYCNKEDIEQIRQELISYGYIKHHSNKPQRKNAKKVKPLEFEKFNTLFYVGKNNYQNEFLTFEEARYNDYFFHVKDYPGSHVLVKTSELNEDIIRYAANLAACYSKAKDSSSVPVNYTMIKNVKKIPGGKIGKVILKTYKTIYIDPDKDGTNI